MQHNSMGMQSLKGSLLNKSEGYLFRPLSVRVSTSGVCSDFEFFIQFKVICQWSMRVIRRPGKLQKVSTQGDFHPPRRRSQPHVPPDRPQRDAQRRADLRVRQPLVTEFDHPTGISLQRPIRTPLVFTLLLGLLDARRLPLLTAGGTGNP